MTSDRVMAHVAPNIVMRIHGQWEAGYGPGIKPRPAGDHRSSLRIRRLHQELRRGTGNCLRPPLSRRAPRPHGLHETRRGALHLRGCHRPHPHRLTIPDHGAPRSHRGHWRQQSRHPDAQRRRSPRPSPRLPTRSFGQAQLATQESPTAGEDQGEGEEESSLPQREKTRVRGNKNPLSHSGRGSG